jgi:OFA family oxalate/formate antiporter-like MFS transporter
MCVMAASFFVPGAASQRSCGRATGSGRQRRALPNVSTGPKEALKTWQFGSLWWIFFTNITCGIALLAVASPMAQEVVGMTPVAAASMVGVIGLINGAGRIFWSTVSDYIGRRNVYIVFFLIEILAFYTLATTTTAFLFQALVLVIISCYGGGFSCMPAYLAICLAPKNSAPSTAKF